MRTTVDPTPRRSSRRGLLALATVLTALSLLTACVPIEPPVPAEPSVPAEPTVPGEPTVPTEPGEPTVPGEPSEPSEPTEPSEPPQPDGCDPAATARIFITGLVRLPNGLPPASPDFRVNQQAVLRDRAFHLDAELALSSVNDAGFFFLTPTLVVSPECPKSYVIEVTRTEPDGTVMYAELDVTGLAIAASPGPDIIDADITSTPIVLEVISQPTPPTPPEAPAQDSSEPVPTDQPTTTEPATPGASPEDGVPATIPAPPTARPATADRLRSRRR